MRAATTLTLLLLAGLLAGTRAQGIAFGSDLDAALAAAEASGKPVLLDAYTTWCAPCRQMERETFALPHVGEAVALRYEPVRLDMESAAGKSVAAQHGVRAYPTLLVLDAEGRELDRSVGYLTEAEFMVFVTRVRSEPPTESFPAMNARFRDGTASENTLERLVDFGTRARHPNTPAYVAALLDARGDWTGESAMTLVMTHVTHDSPLFDTLVHHRRAYAKTLGAYVVSDRIARTLDAGLFPDGQAVSKRAAKRLARRVYAAPQADSTYLRFRMRAAREAGDAKRYGKFALKWQDRYPTTDPEELAELIYVFEARLAGWRDDEVAEWKRRERALRQAASPL